MIIIIGFLSNRLTDFLLEKEIIQEEQMPVYKYGIEIIISSLIGFLLIFTIGLIFGMFMKACIFYTVFVYTRRYSGGYHADTYLKCNAVLLMIYIWVLFFSEAMISGYSIIIHLMILIVYMSSIFGFAPITNVNKPMKKDEINTNRKRCIFISVVWCILSLVLFFVSVKYAIVTALTLFSISMLLIIEKCRKEENIYEEDSK
ncbi:MAG TPA: hypothetical protein DDX91_04310 [Ruminococcaceae bacterium]|nr:hypothetical protein [Oscillospiraceae bacterium]